MFYIDVDGLDSLKEIIEKMRDKGKKIIITSAGPFIIPMLEREQWFADLKRQKLFFNSAMEALETFGFEIKNSGGETSPYC